MEGAWQGEAAGRRSAYRELLRNRNYRLWFAATFASSLGDWMGFVALPILVASLYKTGTRPALFALGGVMLARLAPSLLFGPIAGVLADRYDRRTLIVGTDLTRCVLYLAIAVNRDLIALFSLTFVVECLALLFVSAKDASLPSVVERRQLGEANQLNLLLTWGTLPLGAVAATALLPILALLSRVGVPAELAAEPYRIALALDALTYLISAGLMLRLSLPGQRSAAERQEGPGFVAELREGLTFIRDFPLIRALISGVVGVLFGAGIVIGLGPEFVPAELTCPGGVPCVRSDWFTVLTAVGVGTVLGLGVSVPLSRRVNKERLFPICLAANGAIAALIALLDSFVLVLGLGVLLGVAGGLSMVQGYTLLHEHTRDDTRARTFATLYTGGRVALFAALGLGPFVAATVRTVGFLFGDTVKAVSGIRATILAGGLFGLYYGVSATRGMYRALREGPERSLHLRAPDGGEARGLFVVFEGVEGAGKTTQARRLAQTLEAAGHQVTVTREPGGTPVAEELRSLLLGERAEPMDGRTEALLLSAARAEHVAKAIRPSLEAGAVVICDRFIDSSLAYQGHARGLGEETIAEINRWAVGGLMPDVVVLLQLDPEEGLRRAGKHSPLDRMEREGVEFHHRVADAYRRLAEAEPKRFLVIDGSRSPDDVADDIRLGLRTWLPAVKPGAENEPASARSEPAAATSEPPAAAQPQSRM